MKRVLLSFLLLACHPKTAAIADSGGPPTSPSASAIVIATASASAGLGEDEEEEAQVLDGGACPRSISPDYCRYRCRTFANRKADKHARRVVHSERVAFGKCGGFDVFAEDEQPGDGGVGAGIVEYFDSDAGFLVGAIDTRATSCKQFGRVPTCTPQLTWEEGRAFTLTMGPTEAKSGLPPEVVTRIVRQNFGRYRTCGTNAKDVRPNGHYAAKIHIAKNGAVTSVEDDGTTLQGHETAACIAMALKGLSFPEPAGGPMVARVSLIFSH